MALRLLIYIKGDSFDSYQSGSHPDESGSPVEFRRKTR